MTYRSPHGAPWLRGTVLASRAKGPGFESGPYKHVGTWDFFSCFLVPDPKEGGVKHLVFSEKDEKFRRARVHVAHVKDTSAVGNR